MSSLSDLIKAPIRLLLFCMVIYLASKSFPVGVFVTIIGLSYLYQRLVAFNRSVPAAPKVSVPDYPSKTKPQTPQPEDQPEQYERSAVVTPFRRTGTNDRS
ncbi:hypothetical protein [Cupriavidus pauculus]|uniref:hypothetical protein n=1 Tax=Cupriavidus pauculus TaxID=82633 RepID=UPI001FD08807|nr:hypothetical protein [Cupriavidus pauculus]